MEVVYHQGGNIVNLEAEVGYGKEIPLGAKSTASEIGLSGSLDVGLFTSMSREGTEKSIENEQNHISEISCVVCE